MRYFVICEYSLNIPSAVQQLSACFFNEVSLSTQIFIFVHIWRSDNTNSLNVCIIHYVLQNYTSELSVREHQNPVDHRMGGQTSWFCGTFCIENLPSSRNTNNLCPVWVVPRFRNFVWNILVKSQHSHHIFLQEFNVYVERQKSLHILKETIIRHATIRLYVDYIWQRR
jgi:hypothetical protein